MLEDRIMTTGEVAQRLGIRRSRLAYLIEREAVPGPSATVPGRRLFTPEDVRRIAEAVQLLNASLGGRS